MTMTKRLSGVLLLLLAFATPVRAGVIYPWCQLYGGGLGLATSECAYDSLQQCLETARGHGAICQPNPAYPDEPKKPARKKRQH